MNNELKMRTLAARFFDGETTLDEEQQLYAYFQQPPEALPADLRPLQAMFLDLAALSSCDATVLHQSRQTSTALHRSRQAAPLCTGWHRWAAAAAVALLVAGGALLLFQRHAQAPTAEEDYVAYIYGQRTTDPAVVLGEMQKTMTALTAAGGDSVEEQLKAMFNNDH